MTPEEMIDAGIKALTQGGGKLSYEAAAHTAIAWAALAVATTALTNTKAA